MNGGQPYIDFPIYYGPLTPYASALGQKIVTGERPIGEMALVVFGYTLSYFLLFNLIWQASHGLSIALVVIGIALLLVPRMYKYYIVLGPAATMTALWWYIKYPRALLLVVLSGTIVLTGLFRQDYGAYSLFTAAIVLTRQPMAGRTRLTTLLALVGLTLLFVLPWLIFMAVNGSLGNISI